MFLSATIIYQFKAKNSEMKPYPLCLGNISIDFTSNIVKKKKKKKTVLIGYVYYFSVDYNIDTNNIINIFKYLMKKHIK